MIDPAQLAFDAVGGAVSVALPGVLWAVLFLCAFERGPFAESVGFGRRTFWLLLPGAVAVTLADLPFLPIANDLLGISLGGAVFPIVVGLLAFGPLAPPARRSAVFFLAGLGAVAAAGLGIVLALPSAVAGTLGVVLLGAAVPAVVYALGRLRSDPTLRRVGALLALTDAVLVLTFLFSSATPDQGISELFPQYLVPPLLAGLVASVLAPRLLAGTEGLALAAAYIAGTFGVLVGADVLREPGLYPSSGPGLYVIGGAGVLDLVYLSGLLAFAAAYAGHRWLGSPWTPVPGAASESPPPSPVGQLGRAFRLGLDGDLSGTLRGAAHAARSAAGETAALLGVPRGPTERPWQGLPVPGWVVSDQANLDAAAASGTNDGRESYRGWLTARALVAVSLGLVDRRFARAGPRAIAFLVDLLLVTAPAIAVWYFLAVTTPGGLAAVASSIGFNAAIYGFISLAFLYFVVGEGAFGTTVGKRALGLSVRDRHLGSADLRSVLVRNAFRVPSLTIVGVAVASAIALVASGPSTVGITFEGIGLPAGLLAAALLLAGAVLGVGLLGLVGFVSILSTSERQRWGDLVSGTWVVRPLTPVSSGSPGTVAPPAGPTAPTG